jgi:hypothetical protein
MRKFAIILSFVFTVINAGAQELYVFSEPASNMPAKSMGVKMTAMVGKGVHSKRTLQRYMPEFMLGLNKNWMVHANVTVSDMHQDKMIFESARLYAKWRFLSKDQLHKHFRMAAFGAVTYSRNHLDHNEINLMMGDQGGIQAGIIATQLWHKLAVSGTVSLNEVIDEERRKNIPGLHAYRSVNYSLSAGYLILPFEYKDYDQTNLNFYVELLGSRLVDWPYEKYYVDLAPAFQLIFKSNSKLNLGYRFQLSSDIYRLMRESFLISYDYTFLNALKRKKKKSVK